MWYGATIPIFASPAVLHWAVARTVRGGSDIIVGSLASAQIRCPHSSDEPAVRERRVDAGSLLEDVADRRERPDDDHPTLAESYAKPACQAV